MGSQTHSLLECHDLIIGKGVGLRNDRNQVDLCVKTAHDLDIQWLQRVTCWLDEVYAGVDAVVNNVHTVDLVLSIQIRIEARLDVLDNRSPRSVIVDKVTKARRVDDGQT